mmetsp:Transcript_72496/g.169863  ORF Transcript_72496/g.169863 Transcript_72496/m.169863 type:complete len:244 (-) Transcript_72496:39-770(-)
MVFRRGVRISSKPKPKADTASEGDEAQLALQSQREWETLELEAKQFARSRAVGKLREVSGYEDVAGEGNADRSEPPSPEGPAVSTAPSKDHIFEEAEAEVEEVEDEGEQGEDTGKDEKEKDDKEARARRRAGKKKTGAQKRREKAAREEDAEPRKRKAEDDDRWLKLKLHGEEKPRRIDANRIVSYYDFDSRGDPVRRPINARREADDEDEDFIPGDQTSVAGGNFRDGLRPDMWADSDSEGA